MICSAYSGDQWKRSDEEQQGDEASAKEQVTPLRLAVGSIYLSLPKRKLKRKDSIVTAYGRVFM